MPGEAKVEQFWQRLWVLVNSPVLLFLLGSVVISSVTANIVKSENERRGEYQRRAELKRVLGELEFRSDRTAVIDELLSADGVTRRRSRNLGKRFKLILAGVEASPVTDPEFSGTHLAGLIGKIDQISGLKSSEFRKTILRYNDLNDLGAAKEVRCFSWRLAEYIEFVEINMDNGTLPIPEKTLISSPSSGKKYELPRGEYLGVCSSAAVDFVSYRDDAAPASAVAEP